MTQYWCPEIYRNVFVDRFNDDTIRVAPCCQAQSKLEQVDTFSFETSPYLNKLRQQFNDNQRPQACDRCWTAEDNGHKSRRQSAIEFFNLSPSTDVVLQGIDHSATWACNLACVMCGPHNSSTWASELNFSKTQLFDLGRQFQKSNNFLDRFDLSNISKVHFNGGEPLLNNDQTDLLNQLDKNQVLKNTVVSYNTNGTIMPNEKIVNLWKKARLVKLFFSIDATEKAFEYVRWPGNWQQTSDNLLRMKDQLPSNVMFGFNVTVGSYNLLEIINVWNWFNDNLKTNREGDPSDFCWQLADNFKTADLKLEVKQHAIGQLLGVEQLKGLVQHIRSTLNNQSNDLWITKLNNIDRRRSTDWKKNLSVSKFY